MSNSPLVDFTHLSPHNRGKRAYPVTRITPHHVVGLMSVESLGIEFDGTAKKSANYGIGRDGRVGLYVNEDSCAITSGSYDNDSRAITIECSDYPTEPYEFPEVVYSKLIELCVDICKRYGKRKLLWLGTKEKTLSYKPKDDEMVLTKHNQFAPTKCPGAWMEAHMEDLANKVTEELNEDSAPSKWAEESVGWTIESGILAGDKSGNLMLHSPITTERFCVMLKRYHDRFVAKG